MFRIIIEANMMMSNIQFMPGLPTDVFNHLINQLTRLQAEMPIQDINSTLHSNTQPTKPASHDTQEKVNPHIQSIRSHIEAKDNCILSCFEGIIHLLDSCSLMSKVCKTSDRELFLKAFAYFNQSLVHLVKNLHKYPVNIKLESKKTCLVVRHLDILQQAQDHSLQSSMIDSTYNDIKLLSDNENLMQRNHELEIALVTAQKQIVQTQLKLMSVLNERSSSRSHLSSAKSLNRSPSRQLQLLRNELRQTNEDFTIQIRKYNQVFRSMQQQIQQLQSSSNQGEIEYLETEIIKLREGRERDQMIISELRQVASRNQGYGSKSRLYY